MTRQIVVFILVFTSFVTPAQLVRQDNTTLRFPPSISQTTPGEYELVELAPQVQFDRPVAVATPPGENNRLFVVERAGRIWVISNLAAPSKELFLDLTSKVHASTWSPTDRRTEGLSSVAFHPDFASNHRFFITYNTVIDGQHHNRVSEMLANNANTSARPETEIPLITQYDEGDGHNINEAKFGPDGYLYITTGDEGDGGQGDDFNNAQKIDKDFFSGILRIDVDKKAANLTPNAHPASHAGTYKIPADNPFVDATSFNGLPVDPAKVRTEFWAVGLRNTWRFSFDPQTGLAYGGDVGQHGREEINRLTRGGNYGWAFKEGTLNGSKSNPPAGFSSIPPLVEYAHPNDGRSVTCGVVYRGSSIPSLLGNLLFADFETGNIWAYNVDTGASPKRLGGQIGIAGFGYDPRNGDVLFVNHNAGKIYVLRYSTGVPDNIPPTLDQAGIFSNLQTLTPHTGIYGYSVNTPLWSDDALKRRWFSIPAGKKIAYSPEGSWTIPTGSVFVKHFEIQTKLGDPSTTVRLETRVLVKTDTSVYGLTYKWDDAGQNATLVGDAGDSRGLIINTGSTTRRQVWKFPSRTECLVCHTASASRILGFNTPQLNRDYGYGNVTTNQIQALASADFFENPPAHAYALRALSPIADTNVSRAYRVRSYLAANCSQCHNPGGNIMANWDARATIPLSQASIIYGPLQNNTGPDNKVVYPGRVDRSEILRRMTSTGADRMPPLAVSVPDTNAIQLISDWINQDLPAFQSYEAWAGAYFAQVPSRNGDADEDGITNFAEYLVNSDPTQRTAAANFRLEMQTNGQAALSFTHPAHRGAYLEASDAFPPTEWRVLNDPKNQLRFPAAPTPVTLFDAIAGPQKTYRLRVIEP